MKLPIKPRIRTIAKDEIHIILEYPEWSVKSLLRWIFTGTVAYTQYYEIFYKLDETSKPI